MAQVVFSGATGTITNLNANFTQLYDWREYVTTPGYTGATPKLTLSASYNWTMAAPSSGTALQVSSLTGQVSVMGGVFGAANNPRFAFTSTEATPAVRLDITGSVSPTFELASGGNVVLTASAARNVSIAAPSSGNALSVAQFSGTAGINVTGTSPELRATDGGANAAVVRLIAGNAVSVLDFSYLTTPTPGSIRVSGSESIGISTGRNVTIAAPSSGITAAISGIANGTIATVGDGTRTVAIGTDTANGTAYIGTSTAHPTDIWQGGSAKLRIQNNGNLESIANGLIGYGAGSGGTVTQATSKATGVTLNKASGQITMHAASLGATTSVNFTLTNSTIGANDVVNVAIKSGATAASYLVQVDATAAGSCSICLRNYSASPLSEAVVLNFAVLKASVS